METTLIIIILLLIGAFNLLTLGVLVVLLLKADRTSPLILHNTSTPTQQNPAPTPSEEEQDKIRRQKRAYEDQLTAINEMLNYNADIAYGIKPKDEY